MRKTRQQKARQLLQRLMQGPSISSLKGIDGFEHIRPDIIEPIREQYLLWATTWIINDVIDLVPELKNTPKVDIYDVS